MSLKVEHRPIGPSDATNRYISLTAMPTDTSSVALDIISGTAQVRPNDFTVDGTKVKWDFTSSPLYNQLASGDTVRVIYDRS
jgi:hypothetical protein